MPDTIPTSTNYSLNAGEIIKLAYRKLGVLPSGGVPTADQIEQGIICLNLITKAWVANYPNLWRQEQKVVAVGPGQGTYDNPILLDPLITNLMGARLVQTPSPNLYEIPMTVMAYGDYMNLPNKESKASQPTQICFDRQEDTSRFYIWPLPQNGCTIKLTVARSPRDVIQQSDTLDMPIGWQKALLYNLADMLMDDEAGAMTDPATAQRITERAQFELNKFLDFDRPDSIFIRPYGKSGSRNYRR